MMNEQLQQQAAHDKELAAGREQLDRLRADMLSQLDAIRPLIPSSPDNPALDMLNRVSSRLELSCRTDSDPYRLCNQKTVQSNLETSTG